MTGNQILDAYRAVNELGSIVLPYKAARGVAALKKRLAEERRTILDQEEAIVKKHGGRVKVSGTYKFDTEEQARACAEEIDEFKAQNDDVNLPVVDLSRYTDNLRISGAAIEALEGIVIFEKEVERNG